MGLITWRAMPVSPYLTEPVEELRLRALRDADARVPHGYLDDVLVLRLACQLRAHLHPGAYTRPRFSST